MDTLFLQLSVDHNLGVQYQRSTLETKAAYLGQPNNWSMVAMLRDLVVAVVVGRKRPQSMPLTMLTLKKEMFVFFPVFMVLRLWSGAPLLKEMCESNPKIG